MSTTSILELVVGTDDLLLHNLTNPLWMLKQTVVLFDCRQMPIKPPTATIQLLTDTTLSFTINLSQLKKLYIALDLG